MSIDEQALQADGPLFGVQPWQQQQQPQICAHASQLWPLK
jgi:hypothetical protein